MSSPTPLAFRLGGRYYATKEILDLCATKSPMWCLVEILPQPAKTTVPSPDPTKEIIIYRYRGEWVVITGADRLVYAIRNGQKFVKAKRSGRLPKAIPKDREHAYLHPTTNVNPLDGLPTADVTHSDDAHSDWLTTLVGGILAIAGIALIVGTIILLYYTHGG